MPLIDDIGAIPFSAKKQTITVKNYGTPAFTFSAAIIESIAGLCAECDWTIVQGRSASTVIYYPTGFPSFPGFTSGACGCAGNTVTIVTPMAAYGYSPYVAGQTPVGTTCHQYPLGTTALGSLENLALAISGTSPYNAAAFALLAGGYIITLEAKTTGPANNYDQVLVDGRFGTTNGNTMGGGYILQSNGSSVYQVTITGQYGFGSSHVVEIDVSMTGGPGGVVSYSIDGQRSEEHLIVANPFSFALFDGVGAQDFAVFSPTSSAAEGFDEIGRAHV